jgi:hypothetical protein
MSAPCRYCKQPATGPGPRRFGLMETLCERCWPTPPERPPAPTAWKAAAWCADCRVSVDGNYLAECRYHELLDDQRRARLLQAQRDTERRMAWIVGGVLLGLMLLMAALGGGSRGAGNGLDCETADPWECHRVEHGR